MDKARRNTVTGIGSHTVNIPGKAADSQAVLASNQSALASLIGRVRVGASKGPFDAGGRILVNSCLKTCHVNLVSVCQRSGMLFRTH